MGTSFGSASSGTTGTSTTATTLTATKPTGTASGDLLIAVMVMGQNGNIATMGVGTSGFTDSGIAYTAPNTGVKLKVFYKDAGASEPASYTFATDAAGSTVVEVIRVPGAASSPFDVTPVTNAAAATDSTWTAAAANAATAGDFLIAAWGSQCYVDGTTGNGALTVTPQASMTKIADVQSAYARMSSAYEQLSATGSTGTRTATHTFSASGVPDGDYAAVTILVKPNSVAFSGSATGTLRLAASSTGGKNASGSATATALRLAAAETAAKAAAAAPTATLRLAATETAAKDVPVAATATALRLSASETGLRINAATATLRLGASIAATAHDSTAADTATLHLAAAVTASSVRSNTVSGTALLLAASAAQASARSGADTAALRLAASETAAKNVPASPSAALHLLASETAAKNVPASPSAALRLLASLSGLTGTHGAPTTATALRLSATTSDTGSVRSNTVTATALHLSAVGNGTHIIVEVVAAALTAQAQITVPYELVCVARIPQTSGPPALIPVDPIDYTGLTFTDELSKPQTLSVNTKITSLTETVLQRVRNPSELATELWLYRNGKLVFAGPMLGWQVQGEALTFTAQGLLAYLKMMEVASDQVFKAVDQFTIAKTLIDQWQQLDYGNFGIDTSTVGTCGVTRDATYLAKELHNVQQRVFEIGQRDGGFDITIDPGTRKLELAYPQRGIDRSTGEDSIVFDARNVTSPNVVCSVAPGDVASESFATATGPATLYSVQSNLVRRAQYGRTAVAATFDNITAQATLDAHALGYLTVRDKALLIPGPDTRVTPDADLSTYDVGDTVSYELLDQLGLSGAFRLRKRTVKVSRTGQETVSVAFA